MYSNSNKRIIIYKNINSTSKKKRLNCIISVWSTIIYNKQNYQNLHQSPPPFQLYKSSIQSRAQCPANKSANLPWRAFSSSKFVSKQVASNQVAPALSFPVYQAISLIFDAPSKRRIYCPPRARLRCPFEGASINRVQRSL